MRQPLLSICIPTYNRCQYLRKTLESIVNSEGFCDDVEIIISDNVSTDETQIVGKFFTENYSNIKYFRNEENIKDFNFPVSLDRATGKYIKLNNDNRVFLPGALKYMLTTLRKYEGKQTPVFFANREAFNERKGTDNVECKNLSDFIIHLSYYSTGIWIFGSWKEDWDKVHDKMKYSPLQLSQVDWFCQIVDRRKGCVIMTELCTKAENVGKRTGYQWLKVHVDNYYTILKPYYDEGKISKKAWAVDHRMMLNRMKLALTSVYIYNLMPKGWEFDMSGAREIFWKNFKQFPYFYLYILTSPFWMLWYLIKRFGRILLSYKSNE